MIGLQDSSKEKRLAALRRLYEENEKIIPGEAVNNHVHTTYSFSPYSPSEAIWRAYCAGLAVVGIMDHDSAAGTQEFIEAAEIVGITVTNGVECRVSMADSALAEKSINNPDQRGVAYAAMHAIPRSKVAEAQKFFEVVRQRRGERNRKMMEGINACLATVDITLDYDKDVLPLSQAHDGGSVTERHLLYAIALELIKRFPSCDALMSALEKLGVKVSPELAAEDNPHRAYDLLGKLKTGLIDKFYINATDELVPCAEFTAFANRIGAIPAYAYLGDVEQSVTGDKRPQSFEDSYLDLLFDEIKRLGFKAVTYMPSRNTLEQITRLRQLCAKHDLMQICGEDINSPRQKFICEKLADPEYKDLTETAWMLTKHELC